MAIRNSKKGIFFTFAAIVLALVILVSATIYNDTRPEDKMQAVEIRINTMDSFVKEIDEGIEKVIFIVGSRSLLGLEDYMMKHGKFFNDAAAETPSLSSAFEEAFRNGSVNSEWMGIMENTTFLNWTKKMKIQANKTGIIMEFTVNDVAITQLQPWKVEIALDLEIEAKDAKKTASWSIEKVFKRSINITGFTDPLYLVNNNGLVNNTIRITPVNPAESSSKLNTHLISSYYIEHTDAPSYLMRFENNLASSSKGIESLVNSQKLIDKGLPAKDRSAVDFIYYGAQATTNCKVKNPSYDWFKLDNSPNPNHKDFYNAECQGGGGG